MILDYKDINDLNRYKIMSDTVIPRPIAWIVTEDEGVLNAAPFSYFIPISKKISLKDEDLEVIVNLNMDYFKNRFLTNMDSEHITFELIRLDGILLLSSTKSKTIGKVISDFSILNKTIDKSEVTGLKTID